MAPSTPTSSYDDPVIAEQAKNMTKAIFQKESGFNYNAKGDNGTSSGAGQWQSGTWKAMAQDVLGDANAPMTQANQNVVAQGTMRKWIKDGLNAAQIAARWNSGSEKGWENKVGTTLINGKEIKYNVPKYVKDVTDLYQQFKGKNYTPNAFPLENIANGNQGTNTEIAKGNVKGALAALVDVGGADTNPVVKDMVAHTSPEFQQGVTAARQATEPTNINQTAGSGATQSILSTIAPGAEAKTGIDAMRLAAIPEKAAQIAAAPNTNKNIVKGLLSFADKPATTKDAKVIEPLVQQGLLSAGNTAKATLKNVGAIKDTIGTAAEGLKTEIAQKDVPYIYRELASALKNVKLPGLLKNNDTLNRTYAEVIDSVLQHAKEMPAKVSNVLELRKWLDDEVERQFGNIYSSTRDLTPVRQSVTATRDALHKLITDRIPDLNLHNSLDQQSALYRVLENVATKGAPHIKAVEDAANMPGILGALARHPNIAKGGEIAFKGLLGTGLSAAGLGVVKEALNKLGI